MVLPPCRQSGQFPQVQAAFWAMARPAVAPSKPKPNRPLRPKGLASRRLCARDWRNWRRCIRNFRGTTHVQSAP
ncbi:hypothetical protein THICB1_100025 [Thiomonas arsenitoxydans]|uniref:Uncharacterized protein n=1 Tax=Thiomonas arsenitoxydans (strain DSM 22701 / CIP 110005 / 3As) TaxID=426114 RepID=A0ABP1YX42_THIA3|nr:hypothetical protein THICB1_100025 [Thiomonas arsenitoxydans]